MNGLFYKVEYQDNHGQAYWIGRAFDKYDAIRKSKAHPTQVITAELFDDYEKKNPIDKVNVKNDQGFLFDEDLHYNTYQKNKDKKYPDL